MIRLTLPCRNVLQHQALFENRQQHRPEATLGATGTTMANMLLHLFPFNEYSTWLKCRRACPPSTYTAYFCLQGHVGTKSRRVFASLGLDPACHRGGTAGGPNAHIPHAIGASTGGTRLECTAAPCAASCSDSAGDPSANGLPANAACGFFRGGCTCAVVAVRLICLPVGAKLQHLGFLRSYAGHQHDASRRGA
jgi:hypothetical protein